MSQYPRTVLADATITWGGEKFFVRHGTVVDVVPGSKLEAAYGGPSALSAVLTDRLRGDEQATSHAGISN